MDELSPLGCVFYLFVFVSFLGGCSSINQKDLSPEGRLYVKASHFFQAQGCAQALPLYKQHQSLYPLSKYSQRALQLLESLRLLQKQRASNKPSQLDSWVGDLESKLRQKAFSSIKESLLTPESLKRNSLRRDIRLMSREILLDRE